MDQSEEIIVFNQRSINLLLDQDSEVLNNYILTNQGRQILRKLFLSLSPENSERSILLSGAYGVGKSYLVLLFLTLLRLDEQNLRILYPTLHEQLSKSADFVFSKKVDLEFIPMLFYGYVEDLEEITEKYIYEIVDSYGIDPVKVNRSKNKLSTLLAELSKKNYGIIILFDEFSQYLEKHSLSPEHPDILFLQQLTEQVNSSSNCNMLFVTHKEIGRYVTKLPEAYRSDWRKIEGRFTKLHLNIDLDFSLELLYQSLQAPEIVEMRNNLIDNFDVTQYLVYWENVLNVECEVNHLFIQFTDDLTRLQSILPLHPLSYIVLPLMSAEVGQNERSLSSFISSLEGNSLVSWYHETIDHFKDGGDFERFPTISLSNVWDYFEDSIRQDIGFGGKSEQWEKVQKAIAVVIHQPRNELLIKMIKIIGVFAVCSGYKGIVSNSNLLELAFSAEVGSDIKKLNKSYSIVMNRLSEFRVVRYHKTRDLWSLSDGSHVDWDKEIQTVLDKKVFSETALLSHLSNVLPPFPIYSRKFNSEYDITRYLLCIFEPNSPKKLGMKTWVTEFFKRNNPDGLVLIFPLVEDPQALSSEIQKLDLGEFSSRLFFVLPKTTIEVKDMLYRLAALSVLSKDKDFIKQDEKIQGELSVERDMASDEIIQVVTPYVESFPNSTVINDGMEYSIDSYPEFDKIIYRKFKEVYCKAPKIKNELFNKKKISGGNQKELLLLLNHLINSENPDQAIKGNPPRWLLSRSITINGSIKFIDKAGMFKIKLPDKMDPQNLIPSIEFIHGYLLKDGPISLGDLYHKLENPPYGIRRGILPLIVGIGILTFEDYEVTFFDVTREFDHFELSGELLIETQKDEADYSIIVRKLTDEMKNAYGVIASVLLNSSQSGQQMLINFFGSESDNKISKSRLNLAINKWYTSLPPFTRRTKDSHYLSVNALNVKEALLKFVNNQNETIVEVSGVDMYDPNFQNILEQGVEELNNVLGTLISDIYHEFILTTLGQDPGNVEIAIDRLIEKFAQNSNGVYKDDRRQKFIELIHALSKEGADKKTVARFLSRFLVSLYPRDWDDQTILLFKSRLVELIQSISPNGEEIGEFDQELVYYQDDDQKSVKFGKQELSPIARMLVKTIQQQLEFSGRSLSKNEKLNVINEIIKSMLEGTQ